jgi:hypothetical protein
MTRVTPQGVRVHAIIRHRIESRKRRVARRLDKFNYPDDLSRPMLRGGAIRYELAGRAAATPYGGIGLMQQLVRELQLAEIDAAVLFNSTAVPRVRYVLNWYNALCDGRCLEDLELRRQDEAYLNLLGAERIPDPTTAGDFCRRFRSTTFSARGVRRGLLSLGAAASFFAEARVDADGRAVARTPVQRRDRHRLQRRVGLSPAGDLAGEYEGSAAAGEPSRQPAEPRRGRRAAGRVHRAVS